jgi:hypothetical protein
MPPLRTFVIYSMHLSLSSCCIEDWAFYEKSIYISAKFTFSIYFLARLYQKPKNTSFYIIFLVKLANQYLQLLMGSTTFSLSKGTTIDLLHSGVITCRTRTFLYQIYIESIHTHFLDVPYVFRTSF